MVVPMETDSTYSDVHRSFLQACSNHGLLSIPQALAILTSIRQKHYERENAPAASENHLRRLVKEINDELSAMEQSLEFIIMDFEEQDEFLVFKSESHSSAIKVPTGITDDEGKYFKLIMENVVTSAVYCMPEMQALNLTTGLKVTKIHAEELLAQWSAQGYFVNIDDVISPGPRLICEFGDVLRAKYKEYIRSCFLCKQIIFKGENCPHQCECIIHKRCSAKYFKKVKRCPMCRLDWKSSEDANEVDQ